MCRFDLIERVHYDFSVLFQYISCVGSMIRWNNHTSNYHQFQYISCVGSMRGDPLPLSVLHDFNTSHVSVRSLSHSVSAHTPAISIHLMCRFDFVEIPLDVPLQKFQYISCVGSIFSKIVLFVCCKWFQYISCVGSIRRRMLVEAVFHVISIHLMCRFDNR